MHWAALIQGHLELDPCKNRLQLSKSKDKLVILIAKSITFTYKNNIPQQTTTYENENSEATAARANIHCDFAAIGNCINKEGQTQSDHTEQ